ncbi:hypothetical protein [Pseudonocardia sp.]|uniref:hypothetical protein n=1 Tax=Pseudonocardia sp. TaxID=60912 RepID=UPI003D10ED18
MRDLDADAFGATGAGAAAELDVDDDEVRAAAVGDEQCVAGGAGLADDGQVGFGGEQLPEAEADDPFPVDDEDARGALRDGVVAVGPTCRPGPREYGVDGHRRCLLRHLVGAP